MPAAGRAESFTWIAYLQIGLICILAPVFMGGAIAQEASPRTWEVLLTTPLGAAQIVLGNLFGRLFFVLALLWDRFGLGERLRPHLRWSSILAGVLLIGAGALFLLTNGTASLAGTTTQWVSTTQDNLLTVVDGIPVWVWPAVVAVLAGAVAWRRVSR